MGHDVVVAICTPMYHRPAAAFVQSLRYLWKPNGAPGAQLAGVTHHLESHDILVVEARNALTEGALAAEPRATHLLWIDDDMVFPADALKRLLWRDLSVVGGLCFNRRKPYQPLLIRQHPDELELAERGEPRHGFCYHYPPDDLFEVDRVGAGFLLVRREVFEAIGTAGWWTPEGGASEDFSFSARAKREGFQLFVDTGLKIGHVGEIVVDEEFSQRNRPFEYNAWNASALEPASGEPVASVVIPTFNQNPKYLRAAVLSAAKQTVPVEVIVVDDGSDPPVNPAGWPDNVRVIRHLKNQGIAAALNTGVYTMRTPWFCWLSSDDLFSSRKVEMQLRACIQGDFRASFHRYHVLAPGDNFARYSVMPSWRNFDEQRRILGQACCINGSTVMIHRSVFDAVGLFNPDFRYGQDWEMWCRVGKRFFWYGLGELLGTRREHDNLTAEIRAEGGERQKVRDEEDARIREVYGT